MIILITNFWEILGPSGSKMKWKRVKEITYNENSETSDNDEGKKQVHSKLKDW